MKIEQIATLLFEIEVASHIAHLQTTSYAKHIALNELYTGIVEHRDTLAEAWQGEFGIISNYGTINTKEGTDIVKYISDCCSKLASFKDTLTDTYLQQIIDNILELLYTVKYKLVNLK
jgi:hypothetical protein